MMEILHASWAVGCVLGYIAGCGLWVGLGRRSSVVGLGYGLWVMGYVLWVMGYGLWVMGCGLWVVAYGLCAVGDG